MPVEFPEAKRLFAGFLEQHPDGNREAFAELLRENPAESAVLQEQFGEFQRLRQQLDLPTRSIAAHLRALALGEAGDVSAPPTPAPAPVKSFDIDALLPGGPRAERRYEVLGEIARGGMGVVFKVWDRDLRRTLAMKVSGLAGRSDGSSPRADSRTLARFLEEAQITGQLDHPGVVPVHELGVDKHGRPYFTMRLVRGEDLETIAKRAGDGDAEWPMARLLGVALRLCETVAYAHSKHVVHRDLKPSNVMVGRYGEVYVMDWGLARVLGDDAPQDGEATLASQIGTLRDDLSQEGSPLFTQAGEILGTPAYMAPEQAVGRGQGAGTAADVYSLGAVLYRLLGGRRPYHGAKPLRTHEYVVALLTGPPTPLSELTPHLAPELIAIVDKAMQRDPTQRYASMQALANDLRAYLEGRVVGAYRTGLRQELVKWVRRHRELSAAVAVASVALLAFWVHSRGLAKRVFDSNVRLAAASAASFRDQDPTQALYYALRAAELDDRSETRSALLEQMELCYEERYFEQGVTAAASPDGTEVAFAQADRPDVLQRWDVERGEPLTDVPLASAAEGPSRIGHLLYSPDGAWIVALAEGSRSAWRIARASGETRELSDGTAEPGLAGEPFAAAIDATSRFAATSVGAGRVRLWRLADGAALADWRAAKGAVRCLRFDDRGELLFVAHEEADPIDSPGAVRVYSVPDGETRAVLAHASGVRTLAVHPSHPRLVFSGTRGQLRGKRRAAELQVWDFRDGVVLERVDLPGTCLDIEFTPQGRFAVVAYDPGIGLLRIGSRRDGQDLEPLDSAQERARAFVWQPVADAAAHAGRAVTCIDFYPWREGQDLRMSAWFLTAGFDDTIRQWRLRTNLEPERFPSRESLRGHMSRLASATWLEGGERIVSHEAGQAGGLFGVHLWRADSPAFLGLTRRPELEVTDLAFDRAGGSLFVALAAPRGGTAGRVEVHRADFASGRLIFEGETHADGTIGPVRRVLLTDDGALIAVGDRGVARCDAQETIAALARAPGEIALCPRTGQVALIDEAGGVERVRFRAGQAERLELAGLEGNPCRVAFSASGEEVAVGTSQGGWQLFDAHSGEERARRRFPGAVQALLSHPDGSWWVNAGDDADHSDLWERAQGQWRRVSREVRARELFVDPARGGVLWTGHYWGELHALGESSRDFHAPDRWLLARTWIADLAFDRAAKHVLAVTGDGTADVFDLRSAAHLATFSGHKNAVLSAALSPDGSWAASGDCKGNLFLWPIDPAPFVRARFPVEDDTQRMLLYERHSYELPVEASRKPR